MGIATQIRLFFLGFVCVGYSMAQRDICPSEEVFDSEQRRCVPCAICNNFPDQPFCGDCNTDFAMYGGNEQKLYKDLFRKYNEKVRPVWNSSHAINVSLTLSINQIVEMDERNQILTTNVWIEQHWMDQKMVWDEAEYDGIRQLRIPATELWIPDITLYDNADSQDYVSSSRKSNAVVTSNGKISLWSKPILLKSTCKIDVKFFPFDMQQCSMKFGSWTYNSFQMNLLKHEDNPDLSTYVPNEQWDLVYAISRRHNIKYDCCIERYPDVTFYFGLKRKPLYYICNLIMPCALLSSLALLGFFMPYNIGVVKVSLSVTLILSLTVFLLIVAKMMPRTSEEVPLIGQYYASTMLLISISTAMNVFVLNINAIGSMGHQVPRWLRTLIFDYLAIMCCVQQGPCPFINKPRRRDKHGNVESHELRYKASHNNHSMPASASRMSGLSSQYPLQQESLLSTTGDRSVRFRTGGATSWGEVDGLLLDERQDRTGEQEGLIESLELGRLERAVEATLKHLKVGHKRQEKAARQKADWTVVAKVFDRVLLLVFVSCTVTTSMVLLLQESPYKPAPEATLDDVTVTHE